MPMDDPDLTTPGGRLRHARQLRDLTQVQLAHRYGTEKQTVYRHETTGKIGRKSIDKYAEILGVSASWLAYGDGPEPDAGHIDLVSVYLGSPLGRDTPPDVAACLRRVPYHELGVRIPHIRLLHRVRELIEGNLDIVAKWQHAESGDLARHP
jgi:transcriptional regulator with XRE-family HTH domain